VLLGRGPGPIGDRAALVHQVLLRLEHLRLIVKRASQLVGLPPLLGGCFGREPAYRLGD
jgi:hypothetical protein